MARLLQFVIRPFIQKGIHPMASKSGPCPALALLSQALRKVGIAPKLEDKKELPNGGTVKL